MNIIAAVETEKCYWTSISLPLEPRPLACKGTELLYKVEVNRYDMKELPVANYNTFRVRAMTYIMPFPRSKQASCIKISHNIHLPVEQTARATLFERALLTVINAMGPSVNALHGNFDVDYVITYRFHDTRKYPNTSR